MSNNANNNKKKKIMIAISSLIIVIIILLLLRSCASDNIDTPVKDFNISSEEESWNGEQNKPKQAQEELMEIPYYGTLWVSEEEPYIWFNNPATNDVYFKYQVLYGGGAELFNVNEYISPGKAIKADVYSILEKGKHDITINISAVDENGKDLNGATQQAVIIVQ